MQVAQTDLSKYNIEEKEYWTSSQRQMNPIHYTISYRGSYKPELPHFFIKEYLGDPVQHEIKPTVFDPFAGRGTTILESNLLGYQAFGNDINPLFEKIITPLTYPPTIEEIEERLLEIPFKEKRKIPFSEFQRNNLLPFYHKKTLIQLLNLRKWLHEHRDYVDRFIEIIATSRLHGHSTGFFSSYSFPQFSVPPQRQLKINVKHEQPIPKDISKRILQKAKRSLKGLSYDQILNLRKKGSQNLITCNEAQNLPTNTYPNNKVDLIITSPPFLAQVDYLADNWLKFWFLQISIDSFKENLIQTNNLNEWITFISKSIEEMYRVLKPRCRAIIEVGDVKHRGKRINLDDYVSQSAIEAGFKCEKIMINRQKFTKLSNCFNVRNNVDGVNTNRCVILQKE